MSRIRAVLVCVCLCFHIVTVVSQIGFFPQRDMRRGYGFGNFFPNPKRITQNLAGILHFQPGNPNRNQYMNTFNNIPGISNNRPVYEQYPPDYPDRRPNNVNFPENGREIPNDDVNFEPEKPQPNPEYNNGGLISGTDENGAFNNGGLISGNNGGPVFGNNNGGLISGNNGGPAFGNNDGGLISGNNGGPAFGNNDGGLISGNNDGPAFGNNDGGLISGNNGGPAFGSNDGGLISGNNGGPAFGNNDGGLISGNNGGPAFGNNNGGLISGNNGGPAFGNNNGGLISGTTNDGFDSGSNDKRPVFSTIEDDGAVSSYDDGTPVEPSPVMVVDGDGENVPVFGDRTGEAEEPPADAPTTLSPLTPVPNDQKNNLNFDGQGVSSQVCRTIDGNDGSCINILACKPYINLLQQAQRNPEAVRVLRGSHCGFEGNNPKVCCPLQKTPNVPPTQPPTQPTASAKAAGDYISGLPEPPVCGVSSASFSRVVGGINATLGDFPWMALLGYKSKRDGSTRWLCGGSLVSSRHVMTAAHCIHNHEDDLYIVRLGELDLARDDEGATPIDVVIKTKTKHEGYDPKSFTNDIGMLLLERDVQFTDLIKPICIPKDAELRARSFVDYNPIIAGWGDTEFRGPAATLLQVLQLPVVSNEDCAQAYSQYKAQVIDQRVLCAGYKKGGKDACQGDSGGPLMQPIWNPDTYKTFFYQIGVVSYGKRCAEAGFPGVYSRVTEFVPWIQKNMLGTA